MSAFERMLKWHLVSYICQSANFQPNRTIRRRIIAISVIRVSRCPPYWIFEEKVFGPFYTLRDRIFYAYTKLGEDISIGGGDMPQNEILNNAPLWRNSNSGSNFDAFRPSRPSCVSSCKMSAKSDTLRPSYSDFTILPFRAHFGVPFAPTFLRVGVTHTHPVSTVRYALESFFSFPKNPPSSKWRRFKEELCRNFGQNFDLLPLCNNWGRWGISVDFCGVSGPPSTV